MPRKVILDVDTGSDDAIAIMVAGLSKCIDLVALCTVWGNLTVEQTTFNTLAVSDAIKIKVPVYKGAATAMTKYLSSGRSVTQRDYHPIIVKGKELCIHTKKLHGLPKPKRTANNLPASLFYLEYLQNAQEPITIIAVAPLTNLGLALTLDPDIIRNIEEIIIMGGGYDITNSSLCSEANIWHDPEAAQIVTHCNTRILMVPLDATHMAALTLEDCEKLKNLNTFAGNFSAKLIQERIEYENALFNEKINKTAVHDALAVCAAIDESVLTNIKNVHCEIAFDDNAEGAVLIDSRRKPSDENIRFAYGADHDKFISMLCQIFQEEV